MISMVDPKEPENTLIEIVNDEELRLIISPKCLPMGDKIIPNQRMWETFYLLQKDNVDLWQSLNLSNRGRFGVKQ